MGSDKIPRVGDRVKYWSGYNMRWSQVARITATTCTLADKTVLRKNRRTGDWPIEEIERAPA
jgi:hypothetical protein